MKGFKIKLHFINSDELFKIVNEYSFNIVFGLSTYIKEHLEKVNYTKNVLIFDNDKSLWNKTYNSLSIISLNQLLKIEKPNVIVWNRHIEQILTQIDMLGLSYKNIYILTDNIENPLFQVNKNYFFEQKSIEYKKYLFKKIVELIEIEPHSYCNRTCWFCPNSFIDRKSETNFMNDAILVQLFKDLRTIEYDKMISFTRYSEPFANDKFYDVLKIARNYLPNAILHANTNGDYINNDSLEKAYNCGLKSLNIQLYLSKNTKFNIENVSKIAKNILKRTSNLHVTLGTISDDWIEYICSYKDMTIRMYSRDFKVNGTNRSNIQVLSCNTNRTSPCLKVFSDVYIDYNANVVPCCNIRSDYSEHKDFVFGTLSKNENSIFDIYFSKPALRWRKHLFTFKEKKYLPCQECSFSLIGNSHLLETYTEFIQNNLAK